MQDTIDLQRKVYEVNRDNANRDNAKYLETSDQNGMERIETIRTETITGLADN